jgi:hypothetical protein
MPLLHVLALPSRRSICLCLAGVRTGKGVEAQSLEILTVRSPPEPFKAVFDFPPANANSAPP